MYATYLAVIFSLLKTHTMKRNFYLLILLVIGFGGFAQVPVIEWQKTFGGSNRENLNCIKQTNDGGYIIVGYTNSINGDVIGNHGNTDVWVVKLNSNGLIEWQRTLGGSGFEQGFSICLTSDEGYIVAANTFNSINGDLTGNTAPGSHNLWLIKLNNNGFTQWNRIVHTSQNDRPTYIEQTEDNGYIVSGITRSPEVSGFHGGQDDCWILRFDVNGNLLWQKALGGSNLDGADEIHQTVDGGFIMVGSTSSNDGNVTNNHTNVNGIDDYWVVKLDPFGSIEWQKTLGGTSGDSATSIKITSDNGYIVSGSSSSNNGDVSGWHCCTGKDYWIVKLNSNGLIEWQKTLGGSNGDDGNDISLTNNNGYIITGRTYSIGGDVSQNSNASNLSGNYWLVRLNSIGGILWNKSIGGGLNDNSFSVQQTLDGGYIVAGDSDSTNGDVTGNHGETDWWIVKLAPEVSPPFALSQTFCSGATINNLVATGQNINWYSTPTGGSALLLSTLLLSTTYYASQTVNSIESARTSVTITINPTTSNTTNINTCNSYTWSVNNQTYISSGTYTSTVDCHTEILNLTLSCTSVINLKLNIEGFYDSTLHVMRPVRANQGNGESTTDVDLITVELRDNTTPTIIIDSITTILEVDGTAVCNFTSAPNGSYYVVVKHRNSLQTWSATAVTVGPTVATYDFSDASSKAFGNNMIEVETGVWAFFTGDINQDGNIDNSDYSFWETDANEFGFGNYVTDLNGDGNVDNTDYSIWEKNANNFVFVVTP